MKRVRVNFARYTKAADQTNQVKDDICFQTVNIGKIKKNSTVAGK